MPGVSVKTNGIETAEMLIDAGVGVKAPYFSCYPKDSPRDRPRRTRAWWRCPLSSVERGRRPKMHVACWHSLTILGGSAIVSVAGSRAVARSDRRQGWWFVNP